MNLLNKQKIGKIAEEEACKFLQAKGFLLLQKNYRCYLGEIDLIMQDQEMVVFVEVRSRSRIDYGTAEESINLYKKNKLTKTDIHFLQKKNWLNQRASRFDVVAIHLLKNEWKFNWIKNAFYF